MPKVELVLPKRHSNQQKIVDEARRFNTVDCGRRFGKTCLGIDRCIDPILSGLPCGWFSPTYKMLTEVWREARKQLAPITARSSVQEHRIETITGGVLEMWSLDDTDAGRSRKYKRVIVDEAAMVSGLEEAWNESIRPTLTDYKGDAYFLSTPKGRNYFYRMWLKGRDENEPDWASWQMPTVSNPYIDPSEVEAAKRQLPERVFQQEYLAEFIEDTGGVFRGVSEVVDVGRFANSPARQDRCYFMGVDLARINDFTVITVFDDQGRQVYFDRFNQISWERQVDTIVRIAGVYSANVLLDCTGVGDPIYEAVRGLAYSKGVGDKIIVDGYKITSGSKEALINNLALAIEHQEINLMDIETQTEELRSYEYDVTPSGNVRMNAPEGMHDDTVIAAALAAWQVKGRMNRVPLRLFSPETDVTVVHADTLPAELDDAGWEEL